MLSQRRIAQLGVGAASLTLVSCMTVLVAGARENPSSAHPSVTPVLSETHINGVSAHQVGMTGSPVTLASTKQ